SSAKPSHSAEGGRAPLPRAIPKISNSGPARRSRAFCCFDPLAVARSDAATETVSGAQLRRERQRAPPPSLYQRAELGFHEGVAALGQLHLLEKRVEARVPDLDAVEAGLDVAVVAGPVGDLADEHVVDPDGRVGDVALDAKGDRA